MILRLHVQSNGLGQGRLFEVKSQELLTSKLHCRGDMKQVSIASRAARSGIGRLTRFWWGNGINRATACRLLVMATSSPA